MNRSLLIGAILVLALLAAIYYFIDIRGHETAVEEQAAALVLFGDFDQRLARSITIEPGTGPTIEVRRSAADSPWTLSLETEVNADPDLVQGLMDTLARLSLEDDAFLPGADGPAAFGLAPPRLSVTVTGEGGAVLARLALGDPSPIGTSRYAAVRDTGEVGLVAAAALEMIPRTAFDLRDRHLMRFQRDDVREVTIEAGDQLALTVRRQDDDWEIVEPIAFSADRELVGNLLWELTECRAQAFPGTVDDQAGVVCRLWLGLADGTSVEARFHDLGDSGTTLLARGPAGEAMALDRAILDTLQRPADAWRQLRPFPRYAWEVDHLTVDRSGFLPVTWVKGGDGAWQREDGASGGVSDPDERLGRALELLTALEACGLAAAGDDSLAAVGLHQPHFTVTLGVEALQLAFPDRTPASVAQACAGLGPTVCGVRPGGDWIYLINEPGRDELHAVLESLSAGPPVGDGRTGE